MSREFSFCWFDHCGNTEQPKQIQFTTQLYDKLQLQDIVWCFTCTQTKKVQPL